MQREQWLLVVWVAWSLALVAALTICMLGAAHAHDPYQGIFNFAGINCCHGQDCVKASNLQDFEPIRQGYRIRSTHEVVPLAETGFSPDENWHVCRKDGGTGGVRCLLVPNGGS